MGDPEIAPSGSGPLRRDRPVLTSSDPVDPAIPLGAARIGGWLLGFLLLCLVVGAAIGVVWSQVVTLPSYTVGSDGVATTTERGLAGMFGSDAWFCALGFLACTGLGLVAWRWFHPLGWPTVLIAITGGLISGLICWWVGYQLGPGPFVPRMAAAKPGDVVPVALTLQTKVSLVVWAFAVVIPILLRASLGRDDEEPATRERSSKRTPYRSEQR